MIETTAKPRFLDCVVLVASLLSCCFRLGSPRGYEGVGVGAWAGCWRLRQLALLDRPRLGVVEAVISVTARFGLKQQPCGCLVQGMFVCVKVENKSKQARSWEQVNTEWNIRELHSVSGQSDVDFCKLDL